MKWIKYVFAISVMVWVAACAQHEPIESGSQLTPDGKVRITMQLDPADFAKPVVSRADTPIPNPNETTIDNILVFVSEGEFLDQSTFVEVVVAEVNGNTFTFTLTPRSDPVWFGVVANGVPRQLFDYIDTNIGWEEFCESVYVNTPLSQHQELDLLALPPCVDQPFTEVINCPFLNYASQESQTIHMVRHYKSEEGVYAGMEPLGGKIKLTRVAAKVTVESEDEDFVPVSMMLYNTPRYGRYIWPSSEILDLSEPGEILTQVYDPSLVKTGTEMALYSYESPKSNPQYLFLNAEYEGVEYTYVLPFDDADGNPMDVVRNHHYKFVIKKGDVGISGFDIGNDDPADYLHMVRRVEFAIDVTDMSAHSIVSNGVYFLGVSNEELIVMADPDVEVENLLAVTVTTDLPDSANPDLTHITAAGVEVTFPSDGKLSLPVTAGQTASTEVKITLPDDVDEGTITIRAGGLTKTVTVRRESPYTYDADGYELGDDILHVELDGDERGQNDWFKGFCANPGGKPETMLTRSSPGTVYVRTKNWKDLSRDVSFYYTRQGGGRTKVFAAMRPDFDFDMSAPNCYIVAPGGTVDIPVEKAYGFWADETFINEDKPLPFENLTAELVWTDIDMYVLPTLIKTGEVYEYKLRVQTNAGKSGNAVVAFKSGGEICWSWHIWITNYAPTTASVWMDRNLGALADSYYADARHFGLLYQWGRKDPFPASASVSANTPKTLYKAGGDPIAGSGGAWGSVTYVGAGTTVANSIRNPLVFNGSVEYPDWLSGSAKNDYLWNDGGKTMFDPCPEGWRVPVRDATRTWNDPSLTKYWGNETTGFANNPHFTWTVDGVNWATTNGMNALPYRGGYYPAAGMCYAGGIMRSSQFGHYWSATPINNDDAYNLNFFMAGKAILPSSVSDAHRYFGFSVRCVQE